MGPPDRLEGRVSLTNTCTPHVGILEHGMWVTERAKSLYSRCSRFF